MRATDGIIAIVLVACAGPTVVEPRAVAQVAQQAQATHVSVLKVEGMT